MGKRRPGAISTLPSGLRTAVCVSGALTVSCVDVNNLIYRSHPRIMYAPYGWVEVVVQA